VDSVGFQGNYVIWEGKSRAPQNEGGAFSGDGRVKVFLGGEVPKAAN